jgi:hypothetical protein
MYVTDKLTARQSKMHRRHYVYNHTTKHWICVTSCDQTSVRLRLPLRRSTRSCAQEPHGDVHWGTSWGTAQCGSIAPAPPSGIVETGDRHPVYCAMCGGGRPGGAVCKYASLLGLADLVDVGNEKDVWGVCGDSYCCWWAWMYSPTTGDGAVCASKDTS